MIQASATSKLQQFLLPLLLFTSGLCGISYEVLYGRMLADIIGDQFIVSTAVLLTFMLGIGLGTLTAHRLWRWLWVIEAAIGLYAAVFALSLPVIDAVLYTHLSALGTSMMVGCTVAVLLLALPAFMIGVSLPLFAGYAHTLLPGRGYFARSYALYNLGAAITVIVVEFWLIRETGIRQATVYMGVLNLLVALALLTSFRGVANRVTHTPDTPLRDFPTTAIVALAICSVASAVFQLTTLRLGEMLLGPYRETFAYVLSVILLGITLGAALVNVFSLGLVSVIALNILALCWTLAGTDAVMALFAEYYPVVADSYWQLVALKYSCIAALALAPAATFGATIPALMNTLSATEQSGSESARTPGYLLFIASTANACGFILMCFVLHKRLGYGELLIVCAGLSTLALAILCVHNQAHASQSPLRPGPGWLIPAAMVVAIAGAQGRWNEALLYQGFTSFHSPEALAQRIGEHSSSQLFKGERDVLSLNKRHGIPILFINGQVSIRLDTPLEKVVGAIAGVFSPDQRKALVLGVGSGATAGTVGLLFDQVEAVEISRVNIENIDEMSEYNFDLGSMENVTLIHDDAIHAVKIADPDYSLILNTVTSPLFFSSSKLYTVDFLAQVRRHLVPGGLYMTWLDSNVGDRGADIMIETVSRAFEHCGLAQISSNYLLMLCSDKPIVAHQPNIVAEQAQLAQYFMHNYKIDAGDIAYQLLHSDLAALRNPAGAALNTLDKPALSFAMADLIDSGIPLLQQRVIDELSLENLEHALGNIDWGLKPMLDAQKRISGYSHYYEAWAQVYETSSRYYRDGLRAQRRGDCESALDFYARTTQLNPRRENLHLQIGLCHETKGNHHLALTEFRTQRSLHPASHKVSEPLARQLLEHGYAEDAVQELESVPRSQRSPLHSELLYRAKNTISNSASPGQK